MNLLENPGPVEALHGDPRTSPVYELYRRFRAVALAGDQAPGAESLGRRLVDSLMQPSDRSSGVLGGQIFLRHGDRFERVHRVGMDAASAGPPTLAADSQLIQTLETTGWLVVFVAEPSLTPDSGPLAAETCRAWLLLGERSEVLVSLTCSDSAPRSDLAGAVATLHSLSDLLVRRRELAEALSQARIVQTSLLPERLVVPPGFAAAVRERPAQIVGGDLDDLLPGGASAFALAIGDATGHGLPGALQARDAVVGLRMAMTANLKLTTALTRISGVLAGSRPVGQFVSLALVEIDRDGSFVWVNAGHVAPLLFDDGGKVALRLDSTGPVLGLDERLGLSYERAFGRLEPGGRLILFTDGIVEAENAGGEEFGTDRLIQSIAAAPAEHPEAIVAAVFDELDRFAAGATQLDDQTLLVLCRAPRVAA